jgi:phospholipid/cholesterol/gamma-HCH transport system ATP-binding protein
MIEFDNISKSFGTRQVLNDVSGRFEKGKTSLIIGTSGTGKSVLLKCLVGLLQPDKGMVWYSDRELISSNDDLRREIRREIGMLFQGSALFDSKSAEENVRFPLDVMTNMPEEEKNDRVNFCLQRVGLEGTNKKMPSELSGGMKKRVGIARAIVMNPQYLFCDEPNSGLDPQTSIRIDNLIKEITEEYDITTVVVTHDMNSVVGIGEHILYLHNGRKEWEGDNESLLRSDNQALEEFVFASKMMRALRDIH